VSSAAYSTLAVTVDERVASVELARPERGNGVDAAWVRDVAGVFGELAAADDVDAVLVRARAGDFCVGMAPEARGELGLEWFEQWERALTAVETVAKPVVCAIAGRCIGAGLQLATVCDVRVAATDAVLAATVPGVGLVPGLSWWRLPRFLGLGRAKHLVLACRELDAGEALAIGLVDEVVERDRLGERAQELARAMLSMRPIAFAETKRLLDAAAAMPYDHACAEFLAAELRCLAAAGAKRDQHPTTRAAVAPTGGRAR